MSGISHIEFRPLEPPPPPVQETIGDMTPREMAQVLWLIDHINHGVELDQVLEQLYISIRFIIPCNRMGLGLVDPQRSSVFARWVKSDRPLRLKSGYTAPLNGSSLKTILDTAQARIINDLEEYAREHPESISTRLLLEEGMRSSLTCPLIIQNTPVGFLFFTSAEPNTYSDAKLRFYQQITAQLAGVIERARLYSELADYATTIEKQNQQIHRDLELARQIQRSFIPSSAIQVPGLDMAFHYQPAMEIGGDLLELVPLPDGRLLIFMADALGHGVQASLIMATLRGMLSSVLLKTDDPGALLGELNRAMQPLLSSYFAVAACIRIDPNAGRIHLARAAIPPALIYSAVTDDVQVISEGGLPLTLDNDEVYAVVDLPFVPGDLLLLATDGLTEASSQADEEYGQDRLRDLFKQHGHARPRELLGNILVSWHEHCGGRPPKDDLTLLVVKRT